ncbi:sulfite exporter TauE/SafE [bacterium BMS3Bbin06]|nr:sulfite exporter TauE/SafE [bacterium BMS3Abin08]GBE34016.1 sulfite exporter TauE/SafE [bacterium BMS3Bbin06]HDO36096.1 sulfite exporter TauE/SafE family protein [Nitrospirota bacterium]
MSRNWRVLLAVIFVIAGTFLSSSTGFCGEAAEAATKGSSLAWWMWPIILFFFTFFLGILAVVAGVGGGVLFVPIVSSFFPFNLDFVRGAGLLVALSGALSAGPGLLRRGLANLRLALPMALIASTCSIFGAMVGLALPTNVVQIALGATIIGIVIIMATAKRSDFPEVEKPDALSSALRIAGIYYEESQGKEINWQIHRTPLGLALFILIGFMAGMFGLGAGWANVPVLNLLLGAPLKISVATSVFLLSITDTAAAWVYVNKGAVLPLIAVPSVAGMMLGTRIGVKILAKAKPKAVKWIVVSILFLAGFRALLKGLGI